MTFAFIIRTISPSARLSPSHSVCRILYAPSVTINRPSPKLKAAVSHLPCPDCDIKVEGFTRSHLCARLHISSQPNLISACSPAPVHPYRTRYGGGLYSAVRPSVRQSLITRDSHHGQVYRCVIQWSTWKKNVSLENQNNSTPHCDTVITKFRFTKRELYFPLVIQYYSILNFTANKQ